MNQSNRAVVTLPSDREILITRVFDAPRALVYRAVTDPALIPLWWGPRTTTTVVEEMDVRVGGAWRFTHRAPDGSEFWFRGEFREVTPPERLVQTSEFEGAPGNIVIDTITLEEHDGKTTMTTREVCESQEVRDAILASGMEWGLNESYERLDELVAAQVAAAG
jgi:uncharacterized protein YndB with AHSA1/START domain